MVNSESLEKAIHERILIIPYDASWIEKFILEKQRLLSLLPQELKVVEHIGSTSVPGLSAKPIIDIVASVDSMEIADKLIPDLCNNGYVTSSEFNATLINQRWLMRHFNGSRTHHLHLVLTDSAELKDKIRFREILRNKPAIAKDYVQLKERLSVSASEDRELYTNAKGDFIKEILSKY